MITDNSLEMSALIHYPLTRVKVGGSYGSDRRPYPSAVAPVFCRPSCSHVWNFVQNALERKMVTKRLHCTHDLFLSFYLFYRHKGVWKRPDDSKHKLKLWTEGFNDPPPVIRLQCTAWPGTQPDAPHATIEIASGRL